jgi:hypothetical protein
MTIASDAGTASPGASLFAPSPRDLKKENGGRDFRNAVVFLGG